MGTPSIKCLICSKQGPRSAFEVVVLSETERKIVPNPLDEYTYCKGCWNLLSDPVHGSNVIGGIANMHLAKAGVRDASERASKFKSALLSKAVARKNTH